MVSEKVKYIDISNIPELLRLVEEVLKTGKPCVLRKNGEDVAQITPVKPPAKKRKSGILTKDDPLWKLIGSVTSAEPTDASKKHEYLGQILPISVST